MNPLNQIPKPLLPVFGAIIVIVMFAASVGALNFQTITIIISVVIVMILFISSSMLEDPLSILEAQQHAIKDVYAELHDRRSGLVDFGSPSIDPNAIQKDGKSSIFVAIANGLEKQLWMIFEYAPLKRMGKPVILRRFVKDYWDVKEYA